VVSELEPCAQWYLCPSSSESKRNLNYNICKSFISTKDTSITVHRVLTHSPRQYMMRFISTKDTSITVHRVLTHSPRHCTQGSNSLIRMIHSGTNSTPPWPNDLHWLKYCSLHHLSICQTIVSKLYGELIWTPSYIAVMSELEPCVQCRGEWVRTLCEGHKYHCAQGSNSLTTALYTGF
jgi:hypothetical protein